MENIGIAEAEVASGVATSMTRIVTISPAILPREFAMYYIMVEEILKHPKGSPWGPLKFSGAISLDEFLFDLNLRNSNLCPFDTLCNHSITNSSLVRI